MQIPTQANTRFEWATRGVNRAMRIEVLLNGKVIHRLSFPICRASKSATAADTQRNIVFRFKGGHTFQGEYHTVKAQTIEGNISQAGADSDALLLGVSFSTNNQVLLNTIHIAKPDKPSTSEVDRGIIVRTFPLRRK